MLTRKLYQVYVVTSKLVDRLVKQEWINAEELTEILEKADKEIESTQNKAIMDVMSKLQGSYSEEARLWAENKMTSASGNHVYINVVERRKAQTDYTIIKRTINKLKVVKDA